MSIRPATLAMLWACLCRQAGAADWALPPLHAQAGLPAAAAVASVPIPADADPLWLEALASGSATIDGHRIQAQTVARWPSQVPRRMLLRWEGPDLPSQLSGAMQLQAEAPKAAGWSFAYELVAASRDSVPWKTALSGVPLEETQYEMYQLNLSRGPQRLGLRLGIRRQGKLYWWQFVRADFVAQGPVFDVLRAGGPIYNEISAVQADVYLVLYVNGTVEAFAHFVNHQREGAATATHGVPVVAFAAPGAPDTEVALDGSRRRFALGETALDLGPSGGYGDAEHPGALRVAAGLAVWQPWADQQVWGELLVDDAGIPEHQIERGVGAGRELLSGQRHAAHRFWAAKAGDELIPVGLARTVRFYLSAGPEPPMVRRYEAPAWWHAHAGALPTGGLLPTFWWALPHAVSVASAEYAMPHPRGGYPFELGRSSRGNDGTLAAAMLLLGHAADRHELCQQALAPAYWWADIAIDHAHFTVHELPKYSWQWIVQPYHRWLDLVYAYWETGDPYLLETARFAADSFYRFFWTNRPHRTVGRDALPVTDLLALWETTGERMYWQRAQEVLDEVRRSYGQTEAYWPGHQSGAGPNGVARQPDWEYIPMVLAQLHLRLLWAGEEMLSRAQRDEMHAFMRFAADLAATRGGEGWVLHGTSLSYPVLTALADAYPQEASHWLGQLLERNQRYGMPQAHDGGKPFPWVTGALWLDAWAWGARWEEGGVKVQPRLALFQDSRAPREAVVSTPRGPVRLALEKGSVHQVPQTR